MDSKQWRLWNIILGVWLFISAFVWTHSRVQFTNSWLLGIIVAAVALISMSVPAVRYVNTLAGIWLFITAFAMPHARVGTVWNNAIVGALVFAVSLVGGTAPLNIRRRATTTTT